MNTIFSLNTSEIIREPGVSDLPFAVKAKFALAIKNEREGNDAKASELLEAAISAEQAK